MESAKLSSILSLYDYELFKHICARSRIYEESQVASKKQQNIIEENIIEIKDKSDIIFIDNIIYMINELGLKLQKKLDTNFIKEIAKHFNEKYNTSIFDAIFNDGDRIEKTQLLILKKQQILKHSVYCLENPTINEIMNFQVNFQVIKKYVFQF
jgi:hypothetical protein